MQYAHTDLLSYEDIDRDVDRIFRVFIDTSLIEFATSRATYWSNVLNLRRKYVTQFDRPDLLQKAGVLKRSGTESPSNFEDISNESLEEQPMDAWPAEDHPGTVGFVFWFDVRAAYWDSAGANKELLATLVPPDELGAFYEEAKAVRDRIHQAQDPNGVMEWRENDARTIIGSLLAKIVAATSSSRRG